MQNASTKLSAPATQRSSVLPEKKKERKKKKKKRKEEGEEKEEEEEEESQFADRRLGNAYTKSHHSSLSPSLLSIFPLVSLFFLLFPSFCRATRPPRIFPSTSPAQQPQPPRRSRFPRDLFLHRVVCCSLACYRIRIIFPPV